MGIQDPRVPFANSNFGQIQNALHLTKQVFWNLSAISPCLSSDDATDGERPMAAGKMRSEI